MISGIVLAAGTASRMGRAKQLLPLRGKPLLQHVVDRVALAGLAEYVVVVGHAHDRVRTEVTLPGKGRFVVNPGYVSGQASSLARALDALGPEPRAAMVFLADEPELSPAAVQAVLAAYEETGRPVVRPRYRGRPGHPVILGREVWSELVRSDGDRGAGPALARHPEWVFDVTLDLEPPISVDTPEDYRALTGALPPPP